MLQPDFYMGYERQSSIPEPSFMPPLPPDVSIPHASLSAASQLPDRILSPHADLTLRSLSVLGMDTTHVSCHLCLCSCHFSHTGKVSDATVAD